MILLSSDNVLSSHSQIKHSPEEFETNTPEVFDVRGKQGMNVMKCYYALRSQHKDLGLWSTSVYAAY